MRRVLAKLQSLFARRRAENEMQREIAAHLQLLEDDYRRQGLDARDAKLAARRRYGNVEAAKELHRDERSFIWLESLWRDLRHAWRGLRASPGFTAVAVGSMALGIGATSAIFSLLHALLIDPFPYKDAERMADEQDSRQSEVESGAPPSTRLKTSKRFAAPPKQSKTPSQAIPRFVVATDGFVENVTARVTPRISSTSWAYRR